MVPHPAGAVVLVRFPFSDLSKTTLRPAVVLADVGRGDRILCQVTSKSYSDTRAVQLDDVDFAKGSLRVTIRHVIVGSPAKPKFLSILPCFPSRTHS